MSAITATSQFNCTCGHWTGAHQALGRGGCSHTGCECESFAIDAGLLDEMRAWLKDCEWADVDVDEIDEFPMWTVLLSIQRHYVGGAAQFVDDADYYGVWRCDPESNMPANVQHVHHGLCVAAGACYRLRNECEDYERATDFEAIADVYASRAMAILAEWEVLTSDTPGTLWWPES